MFPLWLAIAIIFHFLSGYWLWKLINIFYYCDYVTIIHLIPLYHDWSTELEFYIPKLPFNRKTCNYFYFDWKKILFNSINSINSYIYIRDNCARVLDTTMSRELSLTGFGPFSSQTRAKFVGLKIIFKVYSPSLLAFDIDIDKLISRAWLFATLWTVAYQAPLSMGFSRQEY